mmetsp:Transcript_1109/g.2431  ORF Transcript_1109/g.2431 Transcript_1109/m.2431 type:complete len:223 (+) Transcript_1109:413-1081(+)
MSESSSSDISKGATPSSSSSSSSSSIFSTSEEPSETTSRTSSSESIAQTPPSSSPELKTSASRTGSGSASGEASTEGEGRCPRWGPTGAARIVAPIPGRRCAMRGPLLAFSSIFTLSNSVLISAIVEGEASVFTSGGSSFNSSLTPPSSSLESACSSFANFSSSSSSCLARFRGGSSPSSFFTRSRLIGSGTMPISSRCFSKSSNAFVSLMITELRTNASSV